MYVCMYVCMWHFIGFSTPRRLCCIKQLLLFSKCFGCIFTCTWEVGVVINTHSCESCFKVGRTPPQGFLLEDSILNVRFSVALEFVCHFNIQ